MHILGYDLVISDIVDIKTALGVILGALGSYIFYYLAKTKKFLSYAVHYSSIVGHKDQLLPEDFLVKFKGVEIKSLNRYGVLIYNNGNKAFSGDDFLSSSPLKVEIKGNDIIDARVAASSAPHISAMIEGGGDSLGVNFEFLNPKDALLLEIYATGPLSVPIVRGVAKEMTKAPHSTGTIAYFSQRDKLISFAASIFMFAIAWISYDQVEKLTAQGLEKSVTVPHAVLGVMVLMLGIMGLILSVFAASNIPKSMVSNDLIKLMLRGTMQRPDSQPETE